MLQEVHEVDLGPGRRGQEQVGYVWCESFGAIHGIWSRVVNWYSSGTWQKSNLKKAVLAICVDGCALVGGRMTVILLQPSLPVGRL